jgi:hypothetical protein
MHAENSTNNEALIVRLKLSDDEFGDSAERDAAHAVEDRLVELFASGELGEFDGHEFGGGFATLYMYGPSAERMAAAVLPAVADLGRRVGSVLTKRFGPPGSPEVTIRLSEGAA